MTASFFLGLNNTESEFDNYKAFLSMFFCEQNNLIANDIYAKLNELQAKTNSELTIVSAISILHLFEFAFENLTDEETQTSAEIEVNIFKAILLQNEINIRLQDRAVETTEKKEGVYRVAALSMTQMFPYSELINYDIAMLTSSQVIKSVFLFEFLSSNAATLPLLQAFIENLPVADGKEYIKRLMGIIMPILKASKEGYLDLNVTEDEHFSSTLQFIQRLAVADNTVLTDYDFRKIRSAPLYKVAEKTFRVISKLFAIELLHKGVYFKLAEFNSNLKVIPEFRSFYCAEFSERFLLYKILKQIFAGRYIEFSGEAIRQLGVDGGPDYYVRNGNYIYLFESKDIFINAKIKGTYDFDLYETEFRKKLYYDMKGDKVDKKAVLQIITNIKTILTGEQVFDTRYKAGSVYIYPILVLHDRQFNLPGLNHIVNTWFADELKMLKEKGIATGRVKPLVIMDIDTLIYHQDNFSNKKLKLNDVIDEYFKLTTLKPTQQFRNEEHKANTIKRSLMPFSLFLSNYTMDMDIKKVPNMFLDKGYTLLV